MNIKKILLTILLTIVCSFFINSELFKSENTVLTKDFICKLNDNESIYKIHEFELDKSGDKYIVEVKENKERYAFIDNKKYGPYSYAREFKISRNGDSFIYGYKKPDKKSYIETNKDISFKGPFDELFYYGIDKETDDIIFVYKKDDKISISKNNVILISGEYQDLYGVNIGVYKIKADDGYYIFTEKSELFGPYNDFSNYYNLKNNSFFIMENILDNIDSSPTRIVFRDGRKYDFVDSVKKIRTKYNKDDYYEFTTNRGLFLIDPEGKVLGPFIEFGPESENMISYSEYLQREVKWVFLGRNVDNCIYSINKKIFMGKQLLSNSELVHFFSNKDVNKVILVLKDENKNRIVMRTNKYDVPFDNPKGEWRYNPDTGLFLYIKNYSQTYEKGIISSNREIYLIKNNQSYKIDFKDLKEYNKHNLNYFFKLKETGETFYIDEKNIYGPYNDDLFEITLKDDKPVFWNVFDEKGLKYLKSNYKDKYGPFKKIHYLFTDSNIKKMLMLVTATDNKTYLVDEDNNEYGPYNINIKGDVKKIRLNSNLSQFFIEEKIKDDLYVSHSSGDSYGPNFDNPLFRNKTKHSYYTRIAQNKITYLDDESYIFWERYKKGKNYGYKLYTNGKQKLFKSIGEVSVSPNGKVFGVLKFKDSSDLKTQTKGFCYYPDKKIEIKFDDVKKDSVFCFSQDGEEMSYISSDGSIKIIDILNNQIETIGLNGERHKIISTKYDDQILSLVLKKGAEDIFFVNNFGQSEANIKELKYVVNDIDDTDITYSFSLKDGQSYLINKDSRIGPFKRIYDLKYINGHQVFAGENISGTECRYYVDGLGINNTEAFPGMSSELPVITFNNKSELIYMEKKGNDTYLNIANNKIGPIFKISKSVNNSLDFYVMKENELNHYTISLD